LAHEVHDKVDADPSRNPESVDVIEVDFASLKI
jgi:hypothetical protein